MVRSVHDRIALLKIAALLLWLFFAVSLIQAQPENRTPSDPATQRRVALINSYHKGYLWTDEITRGVEDALAGKDVDLHIEYMDTKRQFDVTYQDLLSKLLSLKHGKHQYDVVITSDNNAFNFFRERGQQIFGNTPHVFCGVNYLCEQDLKGARHTTGVNERADIAANLVLIRQLHPDCRRIVVITDNTTTGKRIQEEVERLMIKRWFSGPKLELLYDVSASELIGFVEGFDPQTIVLFTLFFRDNTGVFFEYDQGTEMVCDHAAVPVYGTWNFQLNHGIVGGHLVDGFDQGTTAAKKALAIIDGKNADDIPVRYETPTQLRFDFRELQRHGIPLSLLPPDSQVLHQPVSFYDQNKTLIWSTVFAFCLLLLAFFGVAYGLVHSRQAERRMRRNEENLRTTLHSIGDAVIATDAEGKIVRMNPVAEKLTGWRIDEAEGKPLIEVFHIVHAQTHETAGNSLEKVLSTGEIVNLAKHTKLISKDGTEYHIADSGAPIKDGDGNITGVVLVFQDVTEENKLREQLHQSQKMDAIGLLAGGVAHDFNNMLAGIMGAAEIVKNSDNLGGKDSKFIDMIIQSSTRAADLTSKLLAFSRKVEFTAAPVDVHAIINDTAALLERSIDKKVRINLDMKAADYTVIGDSSQLQNLLMNLCINASHAMPEGGEISISTRNLSLDEIYCQTSPFDISPGEFIEIEVRDTGCGIPHENLQKIFEPFFTTKGQGKGTGLGLSAVYGIVKKHHAVITVYSESGVGTVFHILLPVSEKKAGELIGNKIIKRGTGTILLVEDEEFIRITAKAMLEDMGYEVILAENGQAGVDLFENEYRKIDLVIIDMIMPVMNGREAYEKMKEIDENIQAIFSSGFFKPADLTELRNSGLSGFIRKPYFKVELSRLVAKVLSGQKS